MNTNEASRLPLPPGNLGFPFTGQNKIFKENPQNFRKIFYQKYGAICKTRFLGQKYIYLQGYEAVKFVLTNENRYFTSTTFSNSKRIFGETNIGILTGKEHRERQKLLATALKNKALENYIDIIHNLSQTYLEKWTKSNNPIDLYFELNNYTLELTLKLLLGIDDGSQTEINHYLKDMISGLASIPIAFPWTKLARALGSKKKLFNHIEQIIVRREKDHNFSSDVLGILLAVQKEAENRLSTQELTEQMINLFSLGRKELSSALTSFFILTTEHLDVLKLLKTEQEALDKSEPLSLAKLKKMVYLEQVIKEVLRQAPPVSAGLRRVIQDCSFQGWRIPKGWNAVYQITSVLQDPEIYEQPEKFNPERFNPINAEDKKKTLCYIPFGGGARECIGKEFAYLVIKIFVSSLLNNYSWRFEENQDLTINKFPVSRPANKIEVDFTKIPQFFDK